MTKVAVRTSLSEGIFSASAISTVEQCEMKAHYEYSEGFELKTLSNGLKTGLMMHDAQEMYLRGHNCSAVINSIEQEVKSRSWDEDLLFLPKLRAYIKGYYEAWEAQDADAFTRGRYEVLSIEEDFELRYGGGSLESIFVGRMDAVLLDKERDCIVLMEHKNVSSRDCQDPTSIFWQSLIMNNQLTIYSTYLKEKYNKPIYVWYDVVLTSPATKPKIVNRKTKERESNEEFEERITNVYMDKEENKYIRKMIPVLDGPREQRMQEIIGIAYMASKVDYIGNAKRNTQSCRNYGGCAFFQSCIGIENPYESLRFKKKDHFKQKETDEIPF
tara:strand:+ start:1250 stop:2236 length:987 start_codon:yes stop_codon:yes gene_type:complete